MSKVKIFFKPLIAALVIFALLAAPFFDVVSLSAASAENTCGPVCCCCGDTSDEAAPDDRQSMAAKCGCDMDKREPAEDIPPLMASGLSKNSENAAIYEDNFVYTIDFNSHNFVLKTNIIFDDTGPPLYLIHASFLI